MDSIRNKIRQSKTLLGPFPYFNINDATYKPYQLFLEWYQVAIDNGVYEPQSMTLSTVDEGGFPDARVLILKDIDQYGWYFASSSESKKGMQIDLNKKVALTFYWSKIGRQVRIRENTTLVAPSWTVYRVVPEEVEFWQADEERKHIRLRYKLEGDKWSKNQLWA